MALNVSRSPRGRLSRVRPNSLIGMRVAFCWAKRATAPRLKANVAIAKGEERAFMALKYQVAARFVWAGSLLA